MRIRKEVQAIIFDRQDGEKVLLIKKFDLLDKTHYWRLVKGGIEGSETDEEALKREIFEEVGLRNVQVVRKVYEYRYYFPADTEHRVSVYLVQGDIRETPVLADEETREVIEVKWFDVEGAKKILHFDNEKESLRKVYG